LQFDLFERGVYAARRGMFNLMLPMRDEDFDALASALDEFFEVRAGLLAN
jgi:glutamate-1-semialdehyde 2,1-aminomutase